MTDNLIKAFSELGNYLVKFTEKPTDGHCQDIDELRLSEAINKSIQSNPWYTEESILFAINSIAGELKSEKLEKWISTYNINITSTYLPKNIGVIMAGNIPLVGFFDFLYVLFSGHRIIIKLSSDDRFLLPAISSYLIKVLPAIAERIEFIDEKLEGIDAIIATGSNNSYRYFEYYFGKYPGILRKSRSSIAVLTNEDFDQALKDPRDNSFIRLADDIFRYFGLGCRNVSKLFLPEGRDIRTLFSYFNSYRDVILHNKYHNNYDYYKSIYLINGNDFLDTGYVLFLKDKVNLGSPVSVVLYDEYQNEGEVKEYIKQHDEEIQCVVSTLNGIQGAVAPGKSQFPALGDYADGQDVIEMLVQL